MEELFAKAKVELDRNLAHIYESFRGCAEITEFANISWVWIFAVLQKVGMLCILKSAGLIRWPFIWDDGRYSVCRVQPFTVSVN